MSNPTLWRVMFLAERYGRMTLTLDEIGNLFASCAPCNLVKRDRTALNYFAEVFSAESSTEDTRTQC